MGANDNNLKIIKSLFNGDGGAESKYQNDAILAILIRQDAIVASMTATQTGKYNTLIEPHVSFTDSVKAKSIGLYEKKCQILGVDSIFKPVEELEEEVIEE